MLTKPLTRKSAHSPFRRKRSVRDRTIEHSSKFDKDYFTEKNYNYHDWYLEQSQSIVSEIYYYLRPKRDWVFLDIGCALGGVVEILRRRKYEAYGIDVSKYCLKHSPVKEYLRFGSATDLPCKDNSVDVLTCFDTFQYLTREEAKKAIQEFRRVSRRFVCFESIVREDKLSKQNENPDKLRQGRSLFTREEFLELFREAGFSVVLKGFLPRKIEGWWYDFAFSFNAIFEIHEH